MYGLIINLNSIFKPASFLELTTMPFNRILPILLLLFQIFVFPVTTNAGNKNGKKPEKPKKASIQWLTFEEAVAKNKKEPRKIFIDVYT
ncbi:MAG: hypothetical protein M3Q05_02425, partial [Bacteroidota bacterium]|nr:hypothetical protein [Bacteroidota bacterium]